MLLLCILLLRKPKALHPPHILSHFPVSRCWSGVVLRAAAPTITQTQEERPQDTWPHIWSHPHIGSSKMCTETHKATLTYMYTSEIWPFIKYEVAHAHLYFNRPDRFTKSKQIDFSFNLLSCIHWCFFPNQDIFKQHRGMGLVDGWVCNTLTHNTWIHDLPPNHC